jgi:hypothetical protein
VASNLLVSKTSGLGNNRGSRPKFVKGYAIRVEKIDLGFESDCSVFKDISMNVSIVYDLLVRQASPAKAMTITLLSTPFCVP